MDGNDSVDPKQSTGDMAAFVQNLLQQMQSRFQTMSDSIIMKNILFLFTYPTKAKMKQFHLNGMYIRYSQENKIVHPICKWFLDILNFNALDEMGSRIDELEQSINDLRAEMGAENSPSPSVPAVPKDDSKSPSEV
ncbi:Heat shock factor binding protein, putative [Theobroma cacao]|uniref:Heat shock factor binding protein, putative n=1 Tax=Theobroma cacao TaxID=3641 RepID=A0A061EPA4_THECC|nr:Heat shock factor binding protein, putative [Theobroma cacao]